MCRLMWIPVVIAALLLGGCADWAARWMQDAAYLHQAGRALVIEIHDWRRDIRKLIWNSIIRDAERVKQEKPMNEIPYRAMLCRHYPNLMTVNLIRSVREDTTDVLSKAPGCKVHAEE